MGKLYKPVLGRASGKVGDLVFRNVNGKVFITSHIGSNKISKSPACVNNRFRFAAAVKFAKAVNKLPGLKSVWTKSRIKGGNGYSKIISKNIKSVSNNLITTSNVITPSGFSLTIKDVSLSKTKVSLSFILGYGAAKYTDMNFKANFVIALSKPIKPGTDKTTVLFADSNVTPSAAEYVVTFSKFANTTGETLLKYKKAIVFFAITNINSHTGKDIFSFSYANEISL
jgi:hypothetical protein